MKEEQAKQISKLYQELERTREILRNIQNSQGLILQSPIPSMSSQKRNDIAHITNPNIERKIEMIFEEKVEQLENKIKNTVWL